MNENGLMDQSWKEILDQELKKPYMLELKKFLQGELKAGIDVYPPMSLLFNAFSLTPFDQVRVVIMGQDPYHGPGQAEGLCFSVAKGVAQPPSLKNIFKELHEDLNIPIPNHGSLVSWAKQGVLLLNATLTVRRGVPKSHFGMGWETFTDFVVKRLCEKKEPIVFLLWGRSAFDKVKIGKSSHHLILTSPHPSPFSAHTGFLGNRHFSKTNAFLKEHYGEEINWRT